MDKSASGKHIEYGTQVSYVLAVNGDSYSNNRHKDNGTIIRNGIIYRSRPRLEGVNYFHYYLCRRLKGGGMEIFMIYKDFKDIRLSTLGMGNMRLPTVGDVPHGEIDYERAQEIIDYAMRHGINYYDTAYTYPGSEEFLGTTKEEYEILVRRNIPVMVMEPIRGGRLAALPEPFAERLTESGTGWSLPSWALRFVRRLPGVQVILSGMSTMEQIQENVATFSDERTMTGEQAETLLQVARDFRSSISMACTGCAYCVTECSKKLEIPKFMELYNHLKYVGYLTPPEIDEMPEEAKPHNCIGCKKCTHHCPQGLPIPDVMKELAGWEGKNSAW